MRSEKQTNIINKILDVVRRFNERHSSKIVKISVNVLRRSGLTGSFQNLKWKKWKARKQERQRWKRREGNRGGLEESGGELKDRVGWDGAERHTTGCLWRLMTGSCQSRSHRESRAPAICSKVNGKETRLGRWHGPERMDGGRRKEWRCRRSRAGWRDQGQGGSSSEVKGRGDGQSPWWTESQVEDPRAKRTLAVKGNHHLSCVLLDSLYFYLQPGSVIVIFMYFLFNAAITLVTFVAYSYGLVLAGYCKDEYKIVKSNPMVLLLERQEIHTLILSL